MKILEGAAWYGSKFVRLTRRDATRAGKRAASVDGLLALAIINEYTIPRAACHAMPTESLNYPDTNMDVDEK